MSYRNEEGQNILFKAFFVLFEHQNADFVLYLLNNLPNVERYLYDTNEHGWFPLFRVLHLFRVDRFESEDKKLKKQAIC